jgi:hypothetical protein
LLGLYHLWERIFKQFIVQEYENYNHRSISLTKIKTADFKNLVKLLDDFGWNVKITNFYADLDLLHHVANVVKHGDGKSCEQLIKKAPEMFHQFIVPRRNKKGIKAEHLELTKEHFARFVVATQKFFEQFPEHLETQPTPAPGD